MDRIAAGLRTAVQELWALIVDDWFLAAGAMAAIGITSLLSRTDTPGTGDLTGWLLVAMVLASVAIAVRRAARVRRSREERDRRASPHPGAPRRPVDGERAELPDRRAPPTPHNGR